MASSHHRFFIFSLLIFLSPSKAQQSPKPKALLLPISKDSSTLQYLTHLNLGTPLYPKTLVLDLGGRNLWMDCESGYNSSTYRAPRCGSAACSTSMPIFGCLLCFDAGCHNNSCLISIENTVTRTVGFFEVATDVISIQNSVILPNFIFGCSQTWLVKGLVTGVQGMAGLGRTRLGLPHQLSSKFGPKFALCLPSTSKSNGLLVFGNPPAYSFYPNYEKSMLVDVSKYFAFTKLYVNPVPTADDVPKGERSAEYFIRVTSITINGKPIRLNQTLLSIDKEGYGGTKISTVNPYMVLESSIYEVVAETFGKELKAMNVSKVAPVAPFSECFSTEFLGYTPVGPGVPDVKLVLENNVYWEIQGANLVAQISHGVVCLAFVDGGLNSRTSIVIGAHQLEDNLLVFDVAASKLRFTSTLLSQGIQCSNFNF